MSTHHSPLTTHCPDGFLIVDKPMGLTSQQAVAVIKKLTGAKRVGHAGTLDPLATGILIVGIGRDATRRLQKYLQSKKTYRATVELGKKSDTLDAEGVVEIVNGFKIPNEEEVKRALQKFSGEMLQSPPKYSAKKVAGVRAYKLARAGESFELEPKKVHIYRSELISYNWPLVEALFEVSSGTYIRSLSRDLGEALGTGGILVQLKRTAQAGFTLEDAAKLDELTPMKIERELIRI